MQDFWRQYMNTINYPAIQERLRHWRVPAFFLLALAFFYGFIISHVHGNGAWLYVDHVAETNIYWGDDAYRWFLARSAWINPDVYWFNFSLPAWVLLDGSVAALGQGDLLHARYIKAMLTAVSVFLVYRTCLTAGVARWSALGAAILLAIMPLYFLVGMSFYGESWLLVLVAVAMYCQVHGHRRLLLVSLAVMPLVRPEGIFWVLVFSSSAIFQGRWKELAVLILPGFLFFISIFIFSDIGAFIRWRVEAMAIYQGHGMSYGWTPISAGFFEIFPAPLLLAAVIGMFLSKSRGLRGFYVGAALAAGYWLFTVTDNRALVEPRYFVATMPVLSVALAVFLDGLPSVSWLGRLHARAWQAVAVAMGVAVLLCYFYSLTVVRMAVTAGLQDQRVLQYLADWQQGGKFASLSVEEKAYYEEYADVAMRMLQMNPDIKTLYVGNVQAFYFLDPGRIPSDVRVVFSTLTRGGFAGVISDDRAAGYFAEPPYFGYFNLTDPTLERDKILYLDSFPEAMAYPYHWRVGGSRANGPNDIYLFGGHLVGSQI